MPNSFWAGLAVQQTANPHLERPDDGLVRLGCNYPEMYLLIYFHVGERCNTYLRLLAYVVRGTSMTAGDVSLVNLDHHGCLEVQPSDVLSELIPAWRRDVERGHLNVEYIGNLPASSRDDKHLDGEAEGTSTQADVVLRKLASATHALRVRYFATGEASLYTKKRRVSVRLTTKPVLLGETVFEGGYTLVDFRSSCFSLRVSGKVFREWQQHLRTVRKTKTRIDKL